MRRTLCAGCLLLAAHAFAQLDTNGPNAIFRVNGDAASAVDSIDHDLTVTVPSIFSLTVATGPASAGVVLLSSTTQLTGGRALATPWGGAIDVGSPGLAEVLVLTDGIGATGGVFSDASVSVVAPGAAEAVYDLTFGMPSAADGFRAALQGVVTDATRPPFFLDNTEAADVNLFAGFTVVTPPMPTFVGFGDGLTFPFHGAIYSGVWVHSDGYVHFDDVGTPQSGTGSPIGPHPAIAVCATDWAASDVLVQRTNTAVTVEWGRPGVGVLRHVGTGGTSNRLRLTLELDAPGASDPLAGRFEAAVVALDPVAALAAGSGVIGHAPGTLATAAGAVQQVAAADGALGLPRIAGAGVAQLEEHARSSALIPFFGADGAGAERTLDEFGRWRGERVAFAPVATSGAIGSAGYSSSPSTPPADDAVALVDPVLDAAGGAITIVGRFYGFSDPNGAGGSVTIAPRGGGGAPTPAAVAGVLDGTATLPLAMAHDESQSPLRHGEGLVVTAPPLAPGPVAVTVAFASGSVASVPAYVASSGAIRTTLPFTVPSAWQHVFAPGVTVDYGGVAYTSCYVTNNGVVTFGEPTFAMSSTATVQPVLDGFFGAFSGTTVPGVAIAAAAPFTTLAESSIEVIEEPMAGTVRVSYGNVHHLADAPAGTFAATFGAAGVGSVVFDHAGFRPAESSAAQTVLIGVSDGAPGGTDVDAATVGGLAAVIGTYVAMSPGAVGEVLPPGQPLGLETINGTGLWSATVTPGAPPLSWTLL